MWILTSARLPATYENDLLINFFNSVATFLHAIVHREIRRDIILAVCRVLALRLDEIYETHTAQTHSLFFEGDYYTRMFSQTKTTLSRHHYFSLSSSQGDESRDTLPRHSYFSFLSSQGDKKWGDADALERRRDKTKARLSTLTLIGHSFALLRSSV